jgi:hypothetical protein
MKKNINFLVMHTIGRHSGWKCDEAIVQILYIAISQLQKLLLTKVYISPVDLKYTPGLASLAHPSPQLTEPI